MERGNNGGFNPHRDSHGRYAPAGGAARVPHPHAKELHQEGSVRILQPPPREDGSYYAELWKGSQFVSEVRLTRVHRTELAALRAQAAGLASQPSVPAAAPAAPVPAAVPPKAAAPPATVAWKPQMTPAEADVWAKDSAIKETFTHSVRAGDSLRMADVLRSGFKADHTGSHGIARWGSGIYLAYQGVLGSTGLYERWMERGTTYQARVNVKRPFRIDVGYDDQPDVKRYLPPVLKQQYDERVNADYARQRLQAGPRPSQNFRFNSRTPYQVFKDILQENGYDALIIDGGGMRVGGKQLLVFDPKNVTITGSAAFEHEPYDTDLI